MADTINIRIKPILDTKDISSNVRNIQNSFSKLKLPDKLSNDFSKTFSNLNLDIDKYQKKIAEGIKTTGDVSALEKTSGRISLEFENLYKLMGKVSGNDLKNSFKFDTSDLKDFQTELEEINNQIKQISQTGGKNISEAINSIRGISSNSRVVGTKRGGGLLNNIVGSLNKGDIESAKAEYERLVAYGNKASKMFSNAESGQTLLNNIKSIGQAIETVDRQTQGLTANANEVKTALNSAVSGKVDNLASQWEEARNQINMSTKEVNNYTTSVNAAASRQQEMQGQLDNITNSIKSYFGLDQVFYMIKRIGESAMQTVKDLDASMTETAVVTNFSVSDMWDALPTYTEEANQLGSTIKDVYDATTLYYQQGLNTNQAMALSNETLKMARIAGIDAADATDMMTAALRGFNMELNQTSAQKVNDIYSKLAAVTASDTKEIGEAMERTASIASSANMDFGTTSAFLAQMIETTREAPENLGTAMKTIIARFQEMKTDPTKLVDDEGQALDANKVDTALKSIGVELKNEKGEFRDLDDVFLDISAKWDSLTQGQQRYIATIAAGSRQQSRFIAMMNNYDRTMELVNDANNSAGASQEQFEKTLDSMSSKLNRLKNAWDQFAMGLMNNQILKGGVDILTDIFTIVNKIISAVSKIAPKPFEGFTKSALTLAATLVGLIGSSKLLLNIVSKFSTMVLGKKSYNIGGKIIKNPDEVTQTTQTVNPFSKPKNPTLNLRQSSFMKGYYGSIANEYKNAKEAGGQFNFNPFTASWRGLKSGAKQTINEIKTSKAQIKTALDGISKVFSDSSVKSISSKEFANIFADVGPAASKTILAQSPDFESAIRESFANAVKDANLTAEGEQAAMTFFEGEMNAVKTDSKVSLKDTFNNLSNVSETTKGEDGKEITKKVNFQVSGDAVGKIKSIKENFSGLSGSITNAGSSLTQFGMILQGTPLSAFGTALLTIGTTMQALGATIPGVINVFKVLSALKKGEITIDAVLSAANIGLAASEDAAAASAEGLEATLMGTGIGEILLVIAAVAAAIAGIVKLVDALVVTDDEALESAQNSAAAASEAVDSVKQSTDDLSNSITNLQSLEDGFDGLVKGTAEWNQQLVKTNQAVLDLVKSYPKLQKYVTTDTDGKMSISKKGLDKVTKDQQQKLDRAQALSILADNDVVAANNKKTINSNTKKALSGSYSTKESKYYADTNANLVKTNQANELTAEKNAITNLIASKHYNNQDALINILKDQYTGYKISSSISIPPHTEDDNKKIWMDYYGYTKGKEKNEYKDEQGNTHTVEYDTINKQAADIRALKEVESNAKPLSNALDKANNSFSASLVKSAKDVQKYGDTSQVVSQLLSKDATTNEDTLQAIAKNPDILKKSINKLSKTDLASMLGLDLKNMSGDLETYREQLQTELEDNVQAITKLQSDRNNQLATLIGKSEGLSGKQLDNPTKGFTKEIQARVEKLSSAEKNFLAKTGSDIENKVGESTSTTFVHDALVAFSEGGAEASQKFQDAFSNINWDSPLAAVKQLKANADSADGSIAKTAKDMLAMGDSALSNSAQFQEMYNSNDFSKLADDMKSYIDENGKIDASKVQSMAKSCDSLNTYLKNTDSSAAGVAAALTALGTNGNLALTDLNDGILTLLGSFNQLDDVLASAHDTITNFNPGIDTGEGEDFAKDVSKKASEYYENGEYGNEQLQNYMKLVVGEKRWNEELQKNHGDFEKTESAFIGKVKDFSKGFDSAWLDLTDKFQGGDKKVVKAMDGMKLYYDKSGNVNLKTAGKTTKQVVTSLQKAYGVSKKYAELMLTEFENKSADLKSELANNDWNAGMKKYVTMHSNTGKITTNKAGKIKNYKGVFTSSDVNTISAATGKSTKEILQKIASTTGQSVAELKASGQYIDNTSKAMKSNYTQLSKNLDKASGGDWTKAYTKKGEFQLDKAKEGLSDKGFTSDQTSNMLYNQLQNKGTVTYKGQTLDKSSINSVEDMTAALKDLDNSAKYTKIGEAIADGILKGFHDRFFGSDDTGGNGKKGTGLLGHGNGNKNGKGSFKFQLPGPNSQFKKNPYVGIGPWPKGIITSRSASNSGKGKNGEGKTPKNPFSSTKTWKDVFGVGKNKTSDAAKKYAQKQFHKNSDKKKETPTWLKNGFSWLKKSFTQSKSNKDNKNNDKSNSTKGFSKNNVKSLLGGNSTNLKTPGFKVDVKANTDEANKKVADFKKKLSKIPSKVKTKAEAIVDKAKNSIKTLRKKITGIPTKHKTTFSSINDAAKKKAQDLKKLILNVPKTWKTKFNALTDTAKSAIQSLKSKIESVNGRTIKFKISVTWSGVSQKTKDLIFGKSQYGHNNRIHTSKVPTFASAAKGKGTVGPKNKGGLTLTGEKGFEVGWLPSKNRSVVLGAKGPQMVNLPSDAVVYDHEQSKKILSQKSIKAGSLASSSIGKGGSGNNKNKNNNNNNKDKKKKTGNSSTHKAKTALKKFSDWLYNINKRLAIATRNVTKYNKKFENQLAKATVTRSSLTKNLNKLVASIQSTIRYNTKISKHYQKLLSKLNSKAKTVTVKYKKGKKDKTKKVSAGSYIKKTAGGAYVIDDKKLRQLEKKLSKKGWSNKTINSYIKALREGIKSKLDDYTDKKNDADDAIADALEQINDLAKDIADKFYNWDQTLDSIYNTTQKIDAITAKLTRYENERTYLNSKSANNNSKQLNQWNIDSMAAARKNQIAGYNETITENKIQQGQLVSKINNLLGGGDTSAYSQENSKLLANNEALATKSDAYKKNASIIKKYSSIKKPTAKQTKAYNAAIAANNAEDGKNKELQDENNARINYNNAKIRAANMVKDYVTSKTDPNGHVTIKVDYDKINADKAAGKITEEAYQNFSSLLGDITDTSSQIDECVNNILDAANNIEQMKSEDLTSVADLETSVIEGLETIAQNQIDNLSNINNSINDALSDLTNQVQKALDQRRRDEDNKKTEQDLADQMTKLSYMRMSTNGGNTSDIASLQKSIKDSQKDYQRSLEDQALQKIQDQNDLASKQREQQISILTQQLEYEKAMGVFAQTVDAWLQDPVISQNQLRQVLEAADNVGKGIYAISEENGKINSQIENVAAILKAGTADGNQTDSSGSQAANDIINNDTARGAAIAQTPYGTITSTSIDNKTNPKDAFTTVNYTYTDENGETTTGSKQFNMSKQSGRDEYTAWAQANNMTVDSTATNTSSLKSPITPETTATAGTIYGDTSQASIKFITSGKNKYTVVTINGVSTKYDVTSKAGAAAFSKAIAGKDVGYTGSAGNNTAEVKAVQKIVNKQADTVKNKPKTTSGKKHKKGGLADYTGFGWLDGTPSNPELVLNAKDTKNFIQLKDVLRNVFDSGSVNSNSNSVNNSNYNINVNVDKIANDYDTDKMINRIKKAITQDSQYRNTNAVRNIR